MSLKEKGGAAFPHSVVDHYGGEESSTIHSGMTLRDYFAGQVIAATTDTAFRSTAKEYAAKAYEIADAMLEARK